MPYNNNRSFGSEQKLRDLAIANQQSESAGLAALGEQLLYAQKGGKGLSPQALSLAGDDPVAVGIFAQKYDKIQKDAEQREFANDVTLMNTGIARAQLKSATPSIIAESINLIGSRVNKYVADPAAKISTNLTAADFTDTKATSLARQYATKISAVLSDLSQGNLTPQEAKLAATEVQFMATRDFSATTRKSPAGMFKAAQDYISQEGQAQGYGDIMRSQDTTGKYEAAQRYISAGGRPGDISGAFTEKTPTKSEVEGRVLDRISKGEQLTPGEQKIYDGMRKKDFAEKAPTKSGVEGRVLDKVAKGVRLTPGEQKVYAGMRKKGFAISTADGTTVTVGGSGSDTELFSSRGTKGRLEREILDSAVALTDLIDLTQYAESLPPEAFQYLGKGQAFLTDKLNKTKVGQYLPEEWQKFAGQVRDFESRAGQSFTLWRKWATGVQAGQKELDQLLGFYPNAGDSQQIYIAKSKGRIAIGVKSLARLIKLDLIDKVKVRPDGATTLTPQQRLKLKSIPLSSLTIDDAKEIIATHPVNEAFGFAPSQSAQTANEEAALSAPIEGMPLARDIAQKLLIRVNYDKAAAKKLARELGWGL